MTVKALIYFVLAALFMALGVYWRSQLISPEPHAIITRIESNVEKELIRLDEEAKQIKVSIAEKRDWPGLANSFFLHDSTGLIKWNTHQYCPEPSTLVFDSVMYLRSGQGHFLIKQYELPRQQYLTGYIRLQEGYPIQNQYLTFNLNKKIFPMPGVSLDLSGNIHPVKFRGQPIFSISINPSLLAERKFSLWSWIPFLVGVAFWIYASWMVLSKLLNNGRMWIVAILSFVLVYVFRLVMVYGQFPGTDSDWPVFDPREFASSTFNDSIGNLLLNTIAFFAASLGAFYSLKKVTFHEWMKKPELVRIFLVTLFLIVCFASQLLPFLYIETIFHNSTVTPDISRQVYFNSVRWCALACVALSTLTGFFYLFTFFRCAIRVALSNWSTFIIALCIASVGMFLFQIYHERPFEIPILLTIVNLLILYFSSVVPRLKFMFTRVFSLILLGLVIFSFQAALTIRMLSMERQQKAMFKFGNSFLIERDILGEYLLDQVVTKVENDAFIQQQVLTPFSRLDAVTQKIKNNHLNSYFDRYETHIYLFDNRGEPVGNEQVNNLATLIKDFVPLARNTGYRGIYMINNPGDQFLKRYLAVIPVKFRIPGYIVLDLTFRQILPVSVFPKLLLDNRFSDYANSSSYSFAIFNKGRMVNSVGDFKYPNSELIKNIANARLYRQGVDEGGFFHVAIEGLNGQVAIVSSPQYSIFNTMANFAFYFLVGLVFILVGFLIVNWGKWKRNPLTYSDRIQLYVYLAIVLPLLVIAITTLRLNSFSDGKRLEEESVAQATRLAKSIASILEETPDELQSELTRQAQSAGVDATLFSVNGNLLASSQPGIYSNQLVSRVIPPQALFEIKSNNFLFTLDDEVGKLKFRNTFSDVHSPITGEVQAILSLPFFESEASTEKGQIRLFSNILIVFVFVLLAFYLLSFIALNWLTAPLRTIATTLQRTTFSGVNRKLSWKSKDEIGSMVKEYNNMIDNLERSRGELEKRQREAAWREMARQVAHEIKNPLTPIKLTLQQMEKSILEGRAIPEKAIQSVKSVLHQVDILNDIASSFSAFAQMPELKLEQLNLIDLLQETVALFSNSTEGKVVFENRLSAAYTMADQKLFSRIFSNIILNAFQSGKENQLVEVNIKVVQNDTNWVVSFSDNGKGINSEIKDKIFIPYFSTKETGSGLGLAIAKQGIEQAGGRIWCESEIGSGTIFYISLPGMHN